MLCFKSRFKIEYILHKNKVIAKQLDQNDNSQDNKNKYNSKQQKLGQITLKI